MKAFNHCKSSVKYFGGIEEDYVEIHQWFDETKNYYGDLRHRALRHHTLGIQQCEEKFGVYIYNFEDLPDRWHEICDKCQIPRCELPHINKSN